MTGRVSRRVFRKEVCGFQVIYSNNDFVRSRAATIGLILGLCAARNDDDLAIKTRTRWPRHAATFVKTVRMNLSHEAPCVRHCRFLCADLFRQPLRGHCRHLV